MHILNTLSITYKIVIAFSVLLSMTIMIGLLALKQMRELDNISIEIHQKWLPSTKYAGIMKRESTAFRGLEFQHILTDSKVKKQKVEEVMMKHFKVYSEHKKKIFNLIHIQKSKPIFQKINETEQQYVREAHIKAMELSHQNMKKEAMHLLVVEALPVNKLTNQALDDLVSLCSDMSKAAIEKSEELYFHSKLMITLTIILCMMIGIFFIVIFSRLLKNNLIILTNGVKKISNGELKSTITIKEQDEMGTLAKEINKMADSLCGIIGMISQTSSDLSSFSTQMQFSTENILQSFEEVDSQATSVASSSEELAANSLQISNNCNLSVDGVTTAKEYANNGSDTVDETINVISTIAAQVRKSTGMVVQLGVRSNEIGTIIDTIKDIAEQTNLLALNAAIEAARAGDHGRGFAVVADEVRALAERTAKATGDISGMIKMVQGETNAAVDYMNNSMEELESGVSIAKKSGDRLEAIVNQINSACIQIQQIANASLQQADVTRDISQSMANISCVVKERKGNLEEIGSIIKQLSEKAEKLDDIVKKFSI